MKIKIFLAIILAFTSCSNRSSSDIERMKLNGKIKNIIEEKRDRNGELKMTKEIYFTNSGQVESIVYNYPANKISNKSVNHFDFRNRLTRQDFITNDSLISFQEYIQINSKKDSILIYTSNGNLISVAVLEYNNDRQVIESKLFDLHKKLIRSEKSIYDKNGNLIETRIESLDSLLNKETYIYSYDSNCRILTFSEMNAIGGLESMEKYNYETDEMNNWIKKQIMTSDEEVKAIVTRKIEYK